MGKGNIFNAYTHGEKNPIYMMQKQYYMISNGFTREKVKPIKKGQECILDLF